MLNGETQKIPIINFRLPAERGDTETPIINSLVHAERGDSESIPIIQNFTMYGKTKWQYFKQDIQL